MDDGLESPPAAVVVIKGRRYDYFAGCGYLGLQEHPDLAEAAVAAIRRYGLTTATARGGFGEHPLLRTLEEALATWYAVDEAVVLASGYLGNLVLLQALVEQGHHLFVDAAAHYSIWDAARSSGAPLTSFDHGDPADLARQVRRHLAPKQRPLVLSDGVFPITGALAPLADYATVLAAYEGATMAIDDAHAVGVIGPHGHGTAAYWQEQGPLAVPVFTAATLSKALGGYGGFLVGSRAWIGRVRERSAAYRGSSPPPLPAVAATIAALNLIRREPERRTRLVDNVVRMRAGLRRLGWELPEAPVPILCLPARPDFDPARVQTALLARGFAVGYIRQYSGAPPGGALRIAVFATHSAEQIDRLLAALAAEG
jgi:glycine C-acetyltransferase/8-amino-7-oxononanoate synthase